MLKMYIFMLLTASVLVLAQAPVFSTVNYIQDSSGNIDVGNYSDTWVGDWNGDGLKDLIVGAYSYNTADYGRMRVYENQGTNAVPVFTTFYYMQADGADIICNSG